MRFNLAMVGFQLWRKQCTLAKGVFAIYFFTTLRIITVFSIIENQPSHYILTVLEMTLNSRFNLFFLPGRNLHLKGFYIVIRILIYQANQKQLYVRTGQRIPQTTLKGRKLQFRLFILPFINFDSGFYNSFTDFFRSCSFFQRAVPITKKVLLVKYQYTIF